MQRQECLTVSIQEAVQAVINNSMGYKKAVLQFKVPQKTLDLHVKKKRGHPEHSVKKSMRCFTCVFNEA